MINLFETHITKKAIENVNKVLESGWLNEGKWVKKLENTLEDYPFVFTNPVTVNSCTSALHLALICSDVRPGDEVILPAQTFIATGMAVLYTGATPIFVDIDPNTGNIDHNDISNKISSKTKAIIAVHWGGTPCDMEKIQEKANEISIIEDAAHAFGASIQDEELNFPVGYCMPSRFTCFSFQAIKFLTTGDGGVICCANEEDEEKIRRLKWFGIDKSKMTKRFEGDKECSVTEVGYKYNMNDIDASIAMGNLEGIEHRLFRRGEIARRYQKELKDVPGVKLLSIPENFYPSYWVFTMRVDNRKDFIQKMQDAEIQVSVLDRRIDEHPVFGGLTPGLKGQELFDKEQISIPVHDKLTDEKVGYIIKKIQEG